MTTEADILAEVVEPDDGNMSSVAARDLLKLQFNERSTTHIRELLCQHNAGTITSEAREDLDRYLRVGMLIDLIRAKAKLSLKIAED